jgi:hypothetical protein
LAKSWDYAIAPLAIDSIIKKCQNERA